MKILNPQAKIWTLLAGWGGSLIMTDSLGALWYADEIWNYWELSGNPNRDFTKAYTRTLFEQMLENGIKWKYLIIAWAIANFTDVATTFTGIIDILEEKQEEILEQEIQILIRRWGINEKKGLELISNACKTLGITCKVADSSEYMTDILKEIKL
jgi:succinyl-CoA synthetase beta subunit